MSPQTHPQRYRPPRQFGLRNLVVAAGAATVGSLEIIASAGFGLPKVLLHAGLILIVVALPLAGSVLVKYRALQWTLATTAEGVRVLRRKSAALHPWATLNAAHIRSGRIELWGADGRRLEVLPLGKRHVGVGPEEIVATIQHAIDG